MLYQIDNAFFDAVRETSYEDLLASRASNEDGLNAFTGMTMGEAHSVPRRIYKYILHEPKPVLEARLDWKDLKNIEQVDRPTPEPAACAYEYAGEHEDRTVSGAHWYFWAQEIEGVKNPAGQ